MAVVLEYQAWDSSSWLWTDNVTSTAPTQQIMAKLNTFVAASNANPGNAARQITVIRTPSSSTTANYFGFGVQCASPTSGATVHCRLYSSAATNIRSEFSSGFTMTPQMEAMAPRPAASRRIQAWHGSTRGRRVN
jgi:hypothetical protein